MKRALRIDVPEGTDSSLAKELVITTPRTALRIAKSLLYFEERDDGTWRLSYTDTVFTDFTQVQRFVFEGIPESGKLPVKNIKMRIEGTIHHWDIEQVVAIKHNGPRFIRFEMSGGKWKLVISESLLENIPRLTSFTMIREG